MSTGELINQLSNERLRLYRQSAGRPFPREVRARLVEIVRELDRLWDLRRQELASPPFVLPAAEPSSEPAASRAAGGQVATVPPAGAPVGANRPASKTRAARDRVLA